MKRRIVGAITMCFLLGGCASNSNITGDINVGDVNVGKVDVGNVDAGDVNVGNIDVGNISVGDMDEDLERISKYFKQPHEEQTELIQEADLDNDGTPEKITLTNLGYNGGDGGYALSVTTTEDGEEREIPLPEEYRNDFLFSIVWNESGAAIMAGDVCIEQILNKTLEQLYDKEEMTLVREAQEKKETVTGDAISGFTVLEDKTGKSVLVTKSYLSGIGGHADCLGYGISRLCLNEDDTWNVEYQYVLDE